MATTKSLNTNCSLQIKLSIFSKDIWRHKYAIKCVMLAFQHINRNYRVSVWASETGTSHLPSSCNRENDLRVFSLKNVCFKSQEFFRDDFGPVTKHWIQSWQFLLFVVGLQKNGADLKRKNEEYEKKCSFYYLFWIIAKGLILKCSMNSAVPGFTIRQCRPNFGLLWWMTANYENENRIWFYGISWVNEKQRI